MSGYIESYPGRTTIGSCSICGGPVTVHDNWFSVIPDTPQCMRCGAIKADAHGPVIPMKQPMQQIITTSGTPPTADASSTERLG